MIGPLLDDGDTAPGVIAGVVSGSSSSGAAGLDIENDGDYVVSNGAGVANGEWVTPSNTIIAAFYEVKIDPTSGTFDSGTTGSYVSLDSTRAWSKDSGTVTFDATWREIATGIVRLTQTGLTLTAP